MTYVLDVSVALCWVLPRLHSARALQLRDDYRQSVHLLIAPSIFPAEAANALTKAERQKLIPIGDARPLIQDVLTTPPALHPIDAIFYRAVEISSRYRAAFYDCLYVALGEREGCEVVTDDQKMLKNLQTDFPFLRELSSLP
jgi:predicted nucleic acid-binding protein